MEFKKKTIIWEDNNEPPKDYIWAKKDGKFYEYSYAVRGWVESKSISGESEGSDSGGSSEITLSQAFTKAFRLDKKVAFRTNKWVYTDETIPLPDLAMSLAGDTYVMQQYFDRTKNLSDYDITVPNGSINFDDTVYEHTSEVSDSNCIIVPFDEFDEQHLVYDSLGYSGNVYFLYSIDKLSDSFDGGYRTVRSAGDPNYFGLNTYKCLFFVKYNGQLYFFNDYEGD